MVDEDPGPVVVSDGGAVDWPVVAGCAGANDGTANDSATRVTAIFMILSSWAFEWDGHSPNADDNCLEAPSGTSWRELASALDRAQFADRIGKLNVSPAHTSSNMRS